MTDPDAIGSTVPRRQLGRALRDLREEARLRVPEVAKALHWNQVTVYRKENGEVATRFPDVQAMCDLYGADRETTSALVALALETNAKGWWHSYGDVIPAWFDLYVGLEAAAERLQTYQIVIPGILQAKEYAEALNRIAGHPPNEIERLVEIRMGRQRILTRGLKPLQLTAIIEESALHRDVADANAVTAQLSRLIELSELSNVSIQIRPLSARFDDGTVGGSFTILDFPKPPGRRRGEPTTIYCEGFTGALYLDQKRESDQFASAFERIRGGALNETDSRAFLARFRKELLR